MLMFYFLLLTLHVSHYVLLFLQSVYYNPFNDLDYWHLKSGRPYRLPFTTFCAAIVNTCVQRYAPAEVRCAVFPTNICLQYIYIYIYVPSVLDKIKVTFKGHSR